MKGSTMPASDKAEKISITLPQDMLQNIKSKVQAGHYGSTSEVIREAMRLWQQQQEEHETRLTLIKTRIARSLNSGEAVPLEDAFDQVRQVHKRRLAEQQ
jgi:antitoxin ParD1/3/4